MRGSGAVAMLTGARCFVDAVTFSAFAALAHASSKGSEPLPVVPTTLVLFGLGLLLVSFLREAGTERRSAMTVVIVLAAAVAWGFTLPMREPDGFAVLSRAMLFGLIGEAFLWRVLSISRGATRWTDARNAVPLMAVAIAVAVLGPGNVERGPFAPLALLGVAASGLALSLARTTEELALAQGTAGKARASSATSATIVIGLVAILVAAFVPSVQEALGGLGTLLGPAVSRIVYLLILPFAYLAGFLIEVLRPLVTGRFEWPRVQQAMPSPEEDAAMMRSIEEARPYIFGAVELVIIAVAALIAVVLFDRMLRERRLDLPEGVILEREAAGGIGLMDTLRSLRPRRGVRRRALRDDGTAAGAIRWLYWRFLSLAESRGAGWRDQAETPAEHHSRVASADPLWRGASPIVSAFEELRYGEIDPGRETVARARDALRALEASPRGS